MAEKNCMFDDDDYDNVSPCRIIKIVDLGTTKVTVIIFSWPSIFMAPIAEFFNHNSYKEIGYID